MFSQTTKLLPVSRCIQYFAVEKCRRGCTSSLYITGDKMTESCAILTPYIDNDARFKDEDRLSENLKSRGMNFDLHGLKTGWNQFQDVKKYQMQLKKDRETCRVKIKAASEQQSKLLKELKFEYAGLTEKLKIASEKLWNLEKTAVIRSLSLPNDIHPETPPNNSEKVVHTYGLKPDSNQTHPSHLEIAEKLGLLEYYDSSYYFLKGDAAHFELGTSYLFIDKLKEMGFIAMSNSDFARSLVVEGVGVNPHDASSVFSLERGTDFKDPSSRLHLVGGASLISFSSFFTKTVTNSRNLPLRYVTVGRHYNPEDRGLHGLFSTWQSSAVETYVVSANKDMAIEEFKLCLKEAIAVYESLGYHFRVEYLSPLNLRPWESLRASFQMFSRNMNCYIEVGSLSLCDDFISKRLLICCETSGKHAAPYEFAHVVSGTVVSIPRLLGCLLEYDPDFKLPAKVEAAVF